MVQESFNTGERSTISRKKGTALSYQQMRGREEPDETPMDVGPVLTNICISLLIMGLLAAFFRFLNPL